MRPILGICSKLWLVEPVLAIWCVRQHISRPRPLTALLADGKD